MKPKDIFALDRDIAIAWPIRVILLLVGIGAFVAIKLLADSPMVWVIGAIVIGFAAGVTFSPLAPIWVKTKPVDASQDVRAASN